MDLNSVHTSLLLFGVLMVLVYILFLLTEQ